MDKVKRYVLRMVTHPFLFGVYGLSFLFPRNKKVWIFGIPHKFVWNSKYLFLYTQNHREGDITTVWISRDRKLVEQLQGQGFQAFFWLSWQGIYYPLRAGWFIYDASIETINYWLSGGAKKLLLWHGIPLKKIEHDVKNGESSEARMQQTQGVKRLLARFLLPWRFVRADYALSNSSNFEKIYQSAFRLQKEQIVTVGFPKNDIYFESMRGEDIGADIAILARMKKEKAKILLYAPTYRDTGGDAFFERQSDLEELDVFLQKQNLIFVLKMHTLAQKSVTAVLKSGNYKNIWVASPDSDADPLLKHTDVLITDYSGIYFEFLLLDRPVIFFPFDYEKYVTKDRELYFDYEKITPGPKARTLKELLGAIETTLTADTWQEQRKKVRDMCYTYQDGASSERLYRFLKEHS